MSTVTAIFDEQAKPQVFLTAWKKGVHLAGAQFFTVACDSVARAAKINQLRPDLNVVFRGIVTLSTYEQVFLLSLCQFYCDSDVRSYCDEHGLAVPSLPDVANLDDERRAIIVALLDSYTGW